MMDLQTIVDIPKAPFCIEPEETMLFVGSCFAAEIGGRATDDHLRTIVNPYGVMYNPASVCHTVIKAVGDGTIPEHGVSTAIFTLGTNHVYILNETGETIVEDAKSAITKENKEYIIKRKILLWRYGIRIHEV